MTKMNDHLMVEDLMPWDHLALDQDRQDSNGRHSHDDRGDNGMASDNKGSSPKLTGSDRRRR